MTNEFARRGWNFVLRRLGRVVKALLSKFFGVLRGNLGRVVIPPRAIGDCVIFF